MGEGRAGSAPWAEADSACVWLLTQEQEAGCQLVLPPSSHFCVQLLEALHDVPIAHKPIPHGAPLARAPVKGLGFLAVARNKPVPGVAYCFSEGVFRKYRCIVVNSSLLHAVKCVRVWGSLMAACLMWWTPVSWARRQRCLSCRTSLNRGYVPPLVPKCGCWSPEIH